VDYDKTTMPGVYNAGRSYLPATEELWRRTIAKAAENRAIHSILDLGCGTGRYCQILSQAFKSAHIIGVDPSQLMIAQAEKSPIERVLYKQGEAASIPLDDATMDMVFMSMVLHHFPNKEAAIAECRRVLHPGGLICLRAGTQEQVADYPYVSFFDGSSENLKHRLQPMSQIVALFEQAGLRCVSHQIVQSQIAANWADFAKRVALRADSTLTQLSDAAFEDGLADLRTHAAAHPGRQPIVEPIDFFVFEKSG